MASESSNLTTLSRPAPPSDSNGVHSHEHSTGDDHGTALYKPGQGYWVRVLTAVGLSVVFLATALWTAKSLEIVTPPTPTIKLTVTDATGTPKVGDTLTLVQTSKTGTATTTDIGTVKVKALGTDGTNRAVVTIGDAEPAPGKTVRDATSLKAPSFTATIARQEGIPLFQLLYLQGGAAAVILLVGFIFTYWMVGRNHNAVDFLVATDGEMKKVNWSTRKSIIDSTIVVIGACVLISAFLFFADFIFQAVFRFLKVSE